MSASLGGSPVTKQGLRSAVGTIEVDALKEDNMKMDIQIADYHRIVV